ncbi:hypothetical protein H4582DRAFT_2126178, partial [Lactarius indigo]
MTELSTPKPYADKYSAYFPYRGQVREFEQSRSVDDRLTKWPDPTVNFLYAFSATLGEGVGLVFSPAKVIFTRAGVFLLAAKDVRES